MEEDYQIIDDSVNETEGLEINRQMMVYLNETRKWAKFLAVLVFIMAGLMIIGGIATFFVFLGEQGQSSYPDSFSGMPVFMVLIFVAMSALYVIPGIYLIGFANHLKVALYQRNNEKLESAFKNLKSHYKFVGIFVIIGISVYFLAIILGPIIGSGLFM